MADLEAEYHNTVHSSKSFQALAYKKFCAAQVLPSKAWLVLLNKRSKMFINESSFEWACWQTPFSMSEAGLQKLISVLMSVREGPRLMAIKTLTNSWTTSRRLHEGADNAIIHPCFLCGETRMDDLSHYLECSLFWNVLITSANLGAEFLDLDPLSRAGLNNPSKVGFNLIACAFLVYHAIKLEHLEESLNAIAAGDLTHTTNLARRLAEVHLQGLDVRD